MLHYSRHTVRQAMSSYVGAFVALSLGVVLLALTAIAMQSVDAAMGSLGPHDAAARAALDGLTSMLGVMAMMSAFMALFVVGSTFSFVVASRRRELGLLRLVGATRRQIRLLVAGEAVVVSLVAGVVGSAAAMAIGRPALAVLNARDWTPVPLHFQASWLPVLVSAPPAVVVGLLGCWRSARRASKATPIDALREAAVDRRLLTVSGALVGLLALVAAGAGLVVAGLLGPLGALVLSVMLPEVLVIAMVCFGGYLFPAVGRLLAAPFVARGDVTLQLARDNLRGQPRRTASLAAPVVALAAIGGSLIMGLSLAADWQTAITRSQLDASVVVEGGRGVTEALDDNPAIALADADLTSHVRMDGEQLSVSGIDVDAARRTRSLTTRTGSLDAFNGRVAAVGDVTATDMGWHVGDRLRFTWPGGRGTSMRIVAVVPEATDLYAEILVPKGVVAELAPRARQTATFVVPAPGRGRADVERLLTGTGARAWDANAWTDANDKALRASNRIGLLVVLGPVALYAGIAIANTLGIGFLQRRREFESLRLLGATRRQLRRMALLESGLVTAAALLLGTLVTLVVVGMFRMATVPDLGQIPLTVPWLSLGAVLLTCVGTATAATLVSVGAVTRPVG